MTETASMTIFGSIRGDMSSPGPLPELPPEAMLG
jgi:hypothetical protein